MKINEIVLENPFVLAPMAGVTDGTFRRLCREQGAALVYTEMVSAKGLWYGDRKSSELLNIMPEETPAAVQLFGGEPEILAAAVSRLNQHNCALFDVNMGCPVPKIVRNGEGSALMRDPDRAGRIIETMVQKARKPVTAKFRAGWDKQAVNAPEFARVLEMAGASAIGVHGRTRDQFYSGASDLSVIAKVKAAVKIPVFGSGDIMTGADAIDMMERTGCDGVMIARGAMGNPWIFRTAALLYQGADEAQIEAAAPTLRDRAEMFLRHAGMTCAAKGEYIAVREMRKHAGWYFKGCMNVAALRNAVNKAVSLEALTREVKAFSQIKPL